jgi:L-threonylcarbamoyladenylate synthase
VTGDAADAIAAAAAALEAGELVAMPTETVYGLAADATDPKAVAKVFAAKDRPMINPLIVHVGSVEAAAAIVELDDVGESLAKAFWPGALTLVARKRDGGIADLATAGLDTIAVRVPSHPVARALLAAVPFPLVAPSANRSHHVSATSADHVTADLGERVSVVLDAGPSPLGLESTIVQVGEGRPKLLRPGAVTRDRLEQALGGRLDEPAGTGRPTAPGMLRRHYAPAVALRLDAHSVGKGESLLAFGPPPPDAGRAVRVVNLSESGDLVEAAANLFAALRELEAAGAPIAVAPIPEEGLGLAINDRLRRAAAPSNSA